MEHMSYAKGISWIDDCRIPTIEILGREQKSSTSYSMLQGGYNDGYWDNTKGLGRFPANLLVSDDMLNDGNIIQYNKNRTDNGTYLGGHRKEYVGTDDNDVVKQIKGQFFNDKGSNSRYYDIDKWFENLLDSCG